jgi:hypothetical protein
MPIMYQQNSLQMEWCLNCHRNPSKNLRPTSQIYNMAWQEPSIDKPVWCGNSGNVPGTPTAQTVSCTTIDPAKVSVKEASLGMLPAGNAGAQVVDVGLQTSPADNGGVEYVKFTSQDALGKFLVKQYHIRTPQELSSCETCHR